jgi:hypothetical protein
MLNGRIFWDPQVEKRVNPKVGKTRQRPVAQRSLKIPY